MAESVIRDVRLEDAGGILEIYGPVVRQTPISFELEVPSVDEMQERIGRASERWPWIVMEGPEQEGGPAGTGWVPEAQEATPSACDDSENDAESKASGRFATQTSRSGRPSCRIRGYAYAIQFRARAAYQYTAETTVYVHEQDRGQGVGRELMEALLARLRSLGLHRAIAGITLPNEGSIALHEKLGFRPVGVFHQIGRKFDTWHDVGFWELELE